MRQEIICWNCHRKVGEVIKGNILIEATSNMQKIVIESDYVEEMNCRKCHKSITKILIKNN